MFNSLKAAIMQRLVQAFGPTPLEQEQALTMANLENQIEYLSSRCEVMSKEITLLTKYVSELVAHNTIAYAPEVIRQEAEELLQNPTHKSWLNTQIQTAVEEWVQNASFDVTVE